MDPTIIDSQGVLTPAVQKLYAAQCQEDCNYDVHKEGTIYTGNWSKCMLTASAKTHSLQVEYPCPA